MPEFVWCDVDFRPTTFAGWRAVYVDPEERGKTVSVPLAGWLVQHQYPVDSDTGKPRAGDLPFDRRIVPAVHSAGGLSPAASATFMDVLGPEQLDPTLDAARRAWDRWHTEQEQDAA